MERIAVETSPGKKFMRPPSPPIEKLDVVEHGCHPSYLGGISRSIIV
jgi:hypothetical protein